MSYAQKTDVPVERSRADIEDLVKRYGADQFVSGWEIGQALISFRAQKRYVRFLLPLPSEDERQFRRDGRGKARTAASARRQWEQACKSRWRALLLVIKAKLEAVASGITTFEDEFLAHIVLPDGQQVSTWLRPQLEEAYATAQMPSLLSPQRQLALPAPAKEGV